MVGVDQLLQEKSTSVCSRACCYRSLLCACVDDACVRAYVYVCVCECVYVCVRARDVLCLGVVVFSFRLLGLLEREEHGPLQ